MTAPLTWTRVPGCAYRGCPIALLDATPADVEAFQREYEALWRERFAVPESIKYEPPVWHVGPNTRRFLDALPPADAGATS